MLESWAAGRAAILQWRWDEEGCFGFGEVGSASLLLHFVFIWTVILMIHHGILSFGRHFVCGQIKEKQAQN